MFDGGLQGSPQKSGSALPERGGGPALGPRHEDPAGEGGEHDPEGEAQPISLLYFQIIEWSTVYAVKSDKNNHIIKSYSLE